MCCVLLLSTLYRKVCIQTLYTIILVVREHWETINLSSCSSLFRYYSLNSVITISFPEAAGKPLCLQETEILVVGYYDQESQTSWKIQIFFSGLGSHQNTVNRTPVIIGLTVVRNITLIVLYVSYRYCCSVFVRWLVGKCLLIGKSYSFTFPSETWLAAIC